MLFVMIVVLMLDAEERVIRKGGTNYIYWKYA